MMETRDDSSYKLACGQRVLIRRLDAVFSGETKLTLTILGSLCMLAVCMLAGVLAFAGVPAQAAVTHEFLPE